MRILLITQWFDPEPTFKGLAFAQALRLQGHDVTVLTGFPNYPGGKIYPGYRLKPWQRDEVDDISVLRVALYPSHDTSTFGRAFNYISFAVCAAIAALFLRRPDIAYVYHPPGSAALPALVLKWLRSVPFILDIQDMWPDTLSATGMVGNVRLLGAVEGWMRRVYAASAHIVVLSAGFRALLLDRGVSQHKISVIPNWTYEHPTPVADPGLAHQLNFSSHFNIVFAGTMGKAQALDTILEAAELLGRVRPEVRFVLIGGGIERGRLEATALSRNLTNTVFLERRPPHEIPAILDMADALLVHLRDDPLFEITIPSKTQAYLRAGKPILMGVRGDASDVVTQAGAGVAFTPESPESLVAAIEGLLAMTVHARAEMGSAGKRCYEEQFAICEGAKKWAGTFEAARFASQRGFGLKRVLDVFVSLSLLIAIGLPMVIVALSVAIKLGRPVLFSQERPGRYGKPFRLYKFRTMIDRAGPDGMPLPDRDRLTPFGAWLRTTSLDELPSLLNILRGDMSLVGPRPLLMRYTQYFTPEERARLLVRPGLTGWAQINGRNHVSWDDRLALDVCYVRNWRFRLDLHIIVRTALLVFQRRDIVPDAESIMQNLDDERRDRTSQAL